MHDGEAEIVSRGALDKRKKMEGEKSSASAVSERFSPLVLCGLENIGNTCYFNSGLQLLVNCPQFITALRFMNPLQEVPKTDHALLRGRYSSQHTRRLVQLALSTVNDLETASELSVSPQPLVGQLAVVNPQFEGFQQQDCPEMMNSLLALIDDETRIATSTAEELQALQLPPQAAVGGGIRDVAVLRLRKAVDDENERVERIELERKGGIYREGAAFKPPLLFRSGVGDVCRGYTLSEVTCDACRYCSRVIDEFTTLHIEIPTDAQRLEFSKKHPSIDRPGKKKSAATPPSFFQRVSAFLSWLCCCLLCCGETVDYPLTLEECLDIHFDCERLKGSNKYRCGKCGVLGQATKKVSILQLPEVLLLHNKRFSFGTYWSSKKKDHVIFPTASASSVAAEEDREACGSARGGPLDMKPYLVASLPPPRSTMYFLTGVVNHHGTLAGGHYTAYVSKGTHGWVLCNDERITRASEAAVADSQEYMLMYQLATGAVKTEEEVALQHRAREYLLKLVEIPPQVVVPLGQTAERTEKKRRPGRMEEEEVVASANESGGDVAFNGHRETRGNDEIEPRGEVGGEKEEKVVYMSRMWLFRMACFVEPGIVTCTLPPPSMARQRPTFSPKWFFVPVLRSDYERFVKLFGGPPVPISPEQFQKMCAEEAEVLKGLRDAQ